MTKRLGRDALRTRDSEVEKMEPQAGLPRRSSQPMYDGRIPPRSVFAAAKYREPESTRASKGLAEGPFFRASEPRSDPVQQRVEIVGPLIGSPL